MIITSTSKAWLGLLLYLAGTLVPLEAQNLADALPRKPKAVARLEQRVDRTPDKEVWERTLRFTVGADGREVPHGVQVEKRRLKDQERFDTEYTETLQCWYEGQAAAHRIVITHHEGRVDTIAYYAGDKPVITREFDATGAEKPDAQGARGAKHKRQNVLQMYHDVYGDPAPVR